MRNLIVALVAVPFLFVMSASAEAGWRRCKPCYKPCHKKVRYHKPCYKPCYHPPKPVHCHPGHPCHKPHDHDHSLSLTVKQLQVETGKLKARIAELEAKSQ